MEKMEIIAALLPVHALANILIVLSILVQAALGWTIRSRRKAANPPPLKLIRAHRKLGPVLVMMGVFGFFSGWILVFYQYCTLFQYPLHSLTGLTIALLLLGVYFTSRRITGSNPYWRNHHFLLGLAVLCLYFFQVFLGIGIYF